MPLRPDRCSLSKRFPASREPFGEERGRSPVPPAEEMKGTWENTDGIWF